MKRISTLFMMMLMCISMMAQATEMSIDNQTPGWLSSKINYEDQITLEKIKVTGYINVTDLEFVGSMVKHNLRDIDLGDAKIIDDVMPDCYLPVWINDDQLDEKKVSKFILPKNTKMFKRFCPLDDSGYHSHQFKIDTLVYDIDMKYIVTRAVSERYAYTHTHYTIRHLSYLYMGEKIDSLQGLGALNDNNLPSYFENAHFSPNIRVMTSRAIFSPTREWPYNILVFPSLEKIGGLAVNSTINLDTIMMPKIKYYDFSAFQYHQGMQVFLGDNVEQLTISEGLDNPNVYPNYDYNCMSGVNFHIGNKTPPSIDGGNKVKGIFWVPKASYNSYKEKYKYYSGITIHAEPTPLTEIVLNKHEIVMEAGEQMQLRAQPVPYNADNPDILWKSMDDSIAVVSENGLVKAIKSGITKIVAYSPDEQIWDECMVTVATHAESVSISPQQLVLEHIGDTAQLEAIIIPENTTNKKTTWSCSDAAVCTVNDNGFVVATGPGEAVITAITMDGGLVANCLVKVIRHVENVSIEQAEISLYVDETRWLKASIYPLNADNKSVLWSSSDSLIVSVDDNGNIKAKKAGDSYILAESIDNTLAKDSCLIHVLQKVTGISINYSNYDLNTIGETVVLKADVYPEDASNKEVVWKSSNESICVVNNGTVLAVGYGVCVVMATTVDGNYMASCTIKVNDMTGIVDLEEEIVSEHVFDIMGRNHSTLQKGLNIIRLSDGKVKKILVR